jgi:hypothetical protein
MKPNRFNSIFRTLFQRRMLVANSDELMLANAGDSNAIFAVLQGDSFFVPYGQHPHKQGLQILDRAAADEMAANHNSLLGKLGRLVTGGTPKYPVYIGHPDLPGSKDTDKRSYAWIENVIPEETGVRFPVKWSEPGQELISNGHFLFYSPLWWTRKVNGGIRPVALKSMGLTNDPNIPVPALANEAAGYSNTEDSTSNIEGEESQTSTEETTEHTIMNPELIAALGLTEGATLEEVLAAITALKDAATQAAADKQTEADKAMEAETEKQAANARVTLLEGRLKVVANAFVKGAVDAGRITPAEVDAKTEEILAANDVEAALVDFGKLPVKFKTASQTGSLGAAKTRLVVAANDAGSAARQERAQLVANEYERTNPALSEGERKRLAWERAQKKNPEAFAKSPSAAA